MDSLKEKGGESPRIFFTLYQMILPSLSVSLETSMTYRPMMRKLVWWTTQIGFSMDSRMHFQIAIYMMTFQWRDGGIPIHFGKEMRQVMLQKKSQIEDQQHLTGSIFFQFNLGICIRCVFNGNIFSNLPLILMKILSDLHRRESDNSK